MSKEIITHLLPCPFCGEEKPQMVRIGTHRQSCQIACGNCGASHESSDEGEQSGSSWNTRAVIAQPVQPSAYAETEFQIALLKELAEVKQTLLATHGQLGTSQRLLGECLTRECDETLIQPAVLTDEKLLEIARATGLRSHLHGVNATNAKLLLNQYVNAVCAAIAQPVQPSIDVAELATAINETLGGVLHCTRTWQAWQAGTMTQDDFQPANESDLAHEIADVVLNLLNQAQPAPVAQAEPVTWSPTEAAMTALRRVEETCADGEGYDIPRDTMHMLAAIGLTYKNKNNNYSITDFGNSVLAAPIAQSVPVAQAEPLSEGLKCSESYDMIDRYLRNNLYDDDYA